RELSEKKGGNLEIIEISAWLHDIGSLIYGRENHHITGAEVAEKKLRELGYPEDKIEKVKKCVLNHRASIKNYLETIEEKVVAEAECLTFFDNLEGYFLWVIEADKIKNQKEIKKSVKQKTQNKWNQLSLEGKELIKLKYEAIMLLFGGLK
ncbi:MAG: HD domain-containing protein, partial [Nanoarchaeota archaeon]|nr:HD domain-containing protein [Nanoarchaeota archaeon]